MLDTLWPSQVRSGDGLRVLVAEDDDVLRAAVRGLLRLTGHSVDVVCNGREAVEAAEAVDYDVVFLDVQMPEMDGLEAASRLRGQSTGVRPWIVGLSGAPEYGQAAAVGMNDFLAKPVRLDDMVRVFERFGEESVSPSLHPHSIGCP
jgi:CheY-like chemotaxis protein